MSDTTSNDSYTPTPSPSPPPPGGRTAQEWDQAQQLAFQLEFDNESADSVAETRLRLHTRRVLAKPSTMDRPTYTGPLLDVSLRVLPRPADPVMHLNNMTLSAHDHAIKRKIRVGEIKRIIIHVVDFDFTLATSQIFSTLEPQARALYHSRNAGATVDRIKVWITVTPEFARDWYPSLLWNWLNWRDEERAAGRGFHIQYAVSMENQKLTRDELENFRQFLHYIDIDGTMPGDMGGIMAAMKIWFSGEYIRRGF
jgi:hypothetical protein